jgi:hypothetical protein
METTPFIVQDVTVDAINIQAGDVFERHGKTWTARFNARHSGCWTAIVVTETGTVWLSVDEEITVKRVVRRRPCSA